MAVSDRTYMNFLQRRKEQLYTPIKAATSAASLFSPATAAVSNVSRLFTSPARKPQQSVQASQSPQMSFSRPAMSTGQPTIQGSGYSSRYASNPSNYQPKKTQTPPPPPVYTQQKVDPMAQYNQRIDDHFRRVSEASNARIAQEQQNREQEQQLLSQRYGLMSDAIRGSIPTLNSNFNTFKENTQAGVADVVAQGEQQKEQARDYFGEANRTAAQARSETQNQARQKFAAQGAVDSRGAGSYQLANENIDSDYNRYVQKNSKELAYKLSDIDSAVGQYQRQASTLIQTEEAKLQESLRQIEFELKDNEVAKQQAMTQVYQQYQDRIDSIQDTLFAIEQQAIDQKNTIQMELDKLNQTTFTPEFMATGVPTNQAEYEFLVQNADKFKELGIVGDQGDKNKGQVISTIQRLAGGDIAGITGWGQYNPLNKMPGSSAQQTLNDWENLKAMLSLESREKLKGSGAISDYEARVLERASNLGLGTNLSESQFRDRLNILLNEVNGGQIQPNMSTQASSSVVAQLRQAGFTDAEIQEYLRS